MPFAVIDILVSSSSWISVSYDECRASSSSCVISIVCDWPLLRSVTWFLYALCQCLWSKRTQQSGMPSSMPRYQNQKHYCI